jgi:uncharacterized protein involved in exopolysaccharide biosynthesis
MQDILKPIWAGKWVVLSVVAVTLIGVQIYVFYADKVYRATVVLAEASQTGAGAKLGAFANQFQGLAAIAGINVGGQGNSSVALATLKGSDLALQFIREFGIAQKLFAERWNEQNSTWKGKPPTDLQVLKVFNNTVRLVTEERRSGLITLQIQWRDPELAVLWANSLVARVNERLRTRAITEAMQSLEYLRGEYTANDSVETRAAISRLMEAQMRDVMLANVRKEYAYVIVDPPVMPQARDYIWPRRIMLSATALLISGALAALCILIWDRSASSRSP